MASLDALPPLSHVALSALQAERRLLHAHRASLVAFAAFVSAVLLIIGEDLLLCWHLIFLLDPPRSIVPPDDSLFAVVHALVFMEVGVFDGGVGDADIVGLDVNEVGVCEGTVAHFGVAEFDTVQIAVHKC